MAHTCQIIQGNMVDDPTALLCHGKVEPVCSATILNANQNKMLHGRFQTELLLGEVQDFICQRQPDSLRFPEWVSWAWVTELDALECHRIVGLLLFF